MPTKKGTLSEQLVQVVGHKLQLCKHQRNQSVIRKVLDLREVQITFEPPTRSLRFSTSPSQRFEVSFLVYPIRYLHPKWKKRFRLFFTQESDRQSLMG